MNNKTMKLATAAVIIIAVVLSITFLDQSVTSAYALEQTIQASHSVRYLHIKAITPSHEDQPVEFWVELSQNGKPKNMRLNLPDWMAPGGGPREVLWKDNKKQELLKDKNILITSEDEASSAQVVKMFENLDPKLLVTHLQEKQEQGKVILEIDEPDDKAKPTIVTVTFTKEDDSSFPRMVLYIDQATKLINSIDIYQSINDKYEHMKTLEYYDYNQPIAEEMFTFSNVPVDVKKIKVQQEGLAQGELTKEEIAVKVVHQFLEALIAKDYNRASELFLGTSADRVKEIFGELDIIKIVSIAKPTYHSEGNRFSVYYEVEVKSQGKTALWKKEPFVQQIQKTPSRWAITGGF